MRKSILDIAARKAGEPLVCLTAYTAPMARLLDPHCDLLLVGDSVAMVVYGESSTLQADLEMMIRHGRAVVRASEAAHIVVDLPFGTYQESREMAFRSAARVMSETGCGSVKLEGGAEMAETVAYLTQRGVPVMGHVGLMPQAMNTLGGFKAQGRGEAAAAKIIADARAVAEAGAYALVLEGVAESLGTAVTAAVACPVIGIGASAACDGQILVCDDLLGMTDDKKPKFVKEYAALHREISGAAARYAAEVRSRAFPAERYTYQLTRKEG